MTQPSPQYREAMRHAQACQDDGRFPEAISALRVALAEAPGDPRVFASLGEACLGLNVYDRALDCFKLAARYSQGDINYMNRVADVQERLGQLEEASRTYMAAGEVFLRLHRLEPAIDNWERAVRLNPGLLGAHQRLAMAYQRAENTRAAVREYLAIARILQERGQPGKALQMCQAALRLDPANEDARLAMELVRGGAEAFAEPDMVEESQPEPAAPADELAETVRQLATALEAERKRSPEKPGSAGTDPVAAARALAQEQLAAEIFREEDRWEQTPLSKLERDALIGQAMDFELRGLPQEATACFEKAIQGGLKLPAAFFALGMLYGQLGKRQAARQTLRLAGRDPRYQRAAAIVLGRLG